MPGIATHFLVLERTIDALAAAGLDVVAEPASLVLQPPWPAPDAG